MSREVKSEGPGCLASCSAAHAVGICVLRTVIHSDSKCKDVFVQHFIMYFPLPALLHKFSLMLPI